MAAGIVYSRRSCFSPGRQRRQRPSPSRAEKRTASRADVAPDRTDAGAVTPRGRGARQVGRSAPGTDECSGPAVPDHEEIDDAAVARCARRAEHEEPAPGFRGATAGGVRDQQRQRRGRQSAAINNWPGEPFNPPRTVSIGAGPHTGYRFNSAGGVIASLPFTLGSPSSAPANTRATIPNQGSGSWYWITAGIWAGYWLSASASVTLGPAAPSVAGETYQPYRPLYLDPGSYVGVQFSSWGSVTASRAMTVPARTWVPVTVKSAIPGQSMPWYYVTAGSLEGYWLPESPATTLETIPMASFVPSQSSGIAPLIVAFSDTSLTYGPTTWAWDFDNNGTTDSTEQSPTYTYFVAGHVHGELVRRPTALAPTRDDQAELHHGGRAPAGDLRPAVTPARLLDTRVGNGLSGPFSERRAAHLVQVSGRGGVPLTATAVTGTLTVTQQSAAGFVFLGPDPTNSPTSSTLNFPPADNRATGVTVALSPTRQPERDLQLGRPGQHRARVRRDRLLRARRQRRDLRPAQPRPGCSTPGSATA